MNTSFNYKLELLDLRYNIKIGWSKEEKSLPQEVSINIEVFFDKQPMGCVNDNLQDTICYDNLCKKIEELAHSREFNLIEHFAFEIHKLVKSITNKFISITVQKKPSMISTLFGGAKFSIKG